MIRAVIFDFDDTLIHTYSTAMQNLRQVTKQMGVPLPPETELRLHWGRTWKDFNNTLFPQIDLEQAFQQFHMTDAFHMYPAVKGVHESIDALSKGFVLGIVTGRPRALFSKRLQEASLDFNKFAFIMTQDEIQKPKSDPGYFDAALNELAKLGIGKDEVLFVGDSVFDFQASQNAGLHFVGVLTGPATRQDLEKEGLDNHLIIPSVFELPHLIRNNGFHR